MPLKICAVTSTRADWGLLAPVLAMLRDDMVFDLKIVVTGQHLMDNAGATSRIIEDEGFTIDGRVDMKLTGDAPAAVTQALAQALNGYGSAFESLSPDLVLILGDRYEILGAALAAGLARIPVAHIAGGDVTEGAMDDSFRHAITKLSHLHFVTNADARRRVKQMGEKPDRVFVVGSPGLDRIRTTTLLDRAVFFKVVGLAPRAKNLMVTFHPETLAADSQAYCAEMLAALDQLGPDVGLIFSGTNADVQGQSIGNLIATFVKTRSNAVLHASLGSSGYFSALKHADAVVGNSSSGLYEAPSFGTPTVNIGDRQKGRPRASSVIDAAPERSAIHRAILRAFTMDCAGAINPYGDGHAAGRIVGALKNLGDPRALLRKTFVDLPST